MTIGEFKQWCEDNEVTDNFQLTIHADHSGVCPNIELELWPEDTVLISQK